MKTFVRILSLTLVAVMLCATLASCAPASDPAKAEAALKEAEYIVVNDSTITPAVFKLGGYDLTNVVTATKTTEDKDGKTVVELVVIYYFADKDNAEKAFSKVEEAAKEKAEQTKETWVAPTLSGSMVYFGTKNAVKAAK